MMKKYSWLKGGLLLGAVFLVAIWLVKPVGVSTEFAVVDGIFWNILSPGLIIETQGENPSYESTNAYLNKGGGKLAADVKNPFSYGIIFVFSMILGGFLSGKFSRNKISNTDKLSPAVWRNSFGDNTNKRFIFVFIAGFLALFGARLAGGCTSGHMMSGMMQTSLSGYLFAAGAFATAIPIAILMFKSKK
ncbi:YeeE/YedE thiosulfate transporter family protein [Draconibacterium sp.]|jgi:hypothetical protein